jgi:TATA-binding protein-associated factor
LAKDNLLRRHGITSLEISGRVTDQDRQQNIKLFTNDPKYNVMLITIQAGGTGLTLTAADICIFLDKHPNPMKNLQAEDRLYRIGQKNNVNIYSIIAKGTIEEYIENMLRKKEQQFDHIIGGELTFLEKYYNTYMDRWH